MYRFALLLFLAGCSVLDPEPKIYPDLSGSWAYEFTDMKGARVSGQFKLTEGIEKLTLSDWSFNIEGITYGLASGEVQVITYRDQVPDITYQMKNPTQDKGEFIKLVTLTANSTKSELLAGAVEYRVLDQDPTTKEIKKDLSGASSSPVSVRRAQ